MWGNNVCATGETCNVCAECCHDELKNNATACSACIKASCAPGSYGEPGCSADSGAYCCHPGQVATGDPSLPNCLLVGDSVAHGTFALVKAKLNTTCNVYNIENVDAYYENRCFFSTSTSAATGIPMKWSVVHYNEGLHSLYPRVNTTAELEVFVSRFKLDTVLSDECSAASSALLSSRPTHSCAHTQMHAPQAFELGNWTKTLQSTGAKLIYATMTPYMSVYPTPPLL